MDTVPTHVRSRIMASITGDDLRPEREVRAVLAEFRVPFERNAKRLPGTPDFVLLGRRTAVFVHGCFWHGCPEHCKLPATRTEFWRGKFAANRRRDEAAVAELESSGWRVVVVWEHDVRLGRNHLRSLLRPYASMPSPRQRS